MYSHAVARPGLIGVHLLLLLLLVMWSESHIVFAVAQAIRNCKARVRTEKEREGTGEGEDIEEQVRKGAGKEKVEMHAMLQLCCLEETGSKMSSRKTEPHFCSAWLGVKNMCDAN